MYLLHKIILWILRSHDNWGDKKKQLVKDGISKEREMRHMRTFFHYTLYYIAIKEYMKEKILQKNPIRNEL